MRLRLLWLRDDAISGVLAACRRDEPAWIKCDLWGSDDVELVAGGLSQDIASLVRVERAQVNLVGRSEPARWELRVTESFGKTDAGCEGFQRYPYAPADLHSLDEIRDLLE